MTKVYEGNGVKITIDEDTCIGCGACVSVCPKGVLEVVDGKSTAPNVSKCGKGNECVEACPVGSMNSFLFMSDTQKSQSGWTYIWNTLKRSVDSMTNLFSGFGRKEYKIIRDYKYDTALPTLRYMFETDPPKYHVSNDTDLARDVAQIHMRYMFTDMKYDRSYYTDKNYEKFFVAFNSLFGVQYEEDKKIPERKQRKIRASKKTKSSRRQCAKSVKTITKSVHPLYSKKVLKEFTNLFVLNSASGGDSAPLTERTIQSQSNNYNTLDDSNKDEIVAIPNKSPIPKSNKQKVYTIGILPMPGVVMPELPTHPHLKFLNLHYNYKDHNKWLPNFGYYISIFGFKYREDTQTNYPFHQYQEDMVLSYYLYQVSKSIPREIDYVFIPPIGLKMDNQFTEQLYIFMNDGINAHPNNCYLQSYMKNDDRQKNGISGDNYLLSVDWPSYSYQALVGMIIAPETMRRIESFAYATHYLNRYDAIAQHYCEVVDQPIVVSPYNFYVTHKNMIV
ncbi:hypothetical protein QTN25_010418 [Entamoeba marina]